MKNLHGMMGLDVYLSSLSKEELEKVRHLIQPSKAKPSPLICWDFYVNHYHELLHKIQKQSDLEKLDRVTKDFGCQIDLRSIKNKQFDALVLTTVDQTILWVDSGFTSMTGYSRKFSIGKKPKFLQGPNTSTITTNRIRKQIDQERSFTESIVNYRKDRSQYLCKIEVFPIKNVNGITNAFIALENEIK